jgi:hypothetical protein
MFKSLTHLGKTRSGDLDLHRFDFAAGFQASLVRIVRFRRTHNQSLASCQRGASGNMSPSIRIVVLCAIIGGFLPSRGSLDQTRGVLEYWSDGVLENLGPIPPQHSSTPIL